MSNRSFNSVKYQNPQLAVQARDDDFSETGTGRRIFAAQIEIAENKILKRS
jgi:hypothetical protein